MIYAYMLYMCLMIVFFFFKLHDNHINSLGDVEGGDSNVTIT